MKHLRTILIILFLGSCLLWAASYQWITWHGPGGRFVWQLRDGGFVVGRFESDIVKRHPGTRRYGFTISGYAGLPSRWWPDNPQLTHRGAHVVYTKLWDIYNSGGDEWQSV